MGWPGKRRKKDTHGWSERERGGSGAREADQVKSERPGCDGSEREREASLARVCARTGEGREGGARHGAESGMLGGGGDGGHVAVSREKRERSERAP